MIVFGPVPSRRLGRSLGINNIPPKACTYSCVYCQLGRTKKMETAPRTFYDTEEIIKHVAEKIDAAGRAGESIDYLTFVADGEPTLDIHLGTEIERMRSFGLKIAVITNSSLIWKNSVQGSLQKADWVSVKIDSVDETIWRKINRPHRALRLDKILDGIIGFAGQFKGRLATETMLIRGLNDDPNQIENLAGFMQRLPAHTAYLSVPIRPPAEKWARAPDEETLIRAHQIMTEKIQNVEYLIGYEGNAFALTGDIRKDLLSITAVHPMREEAVSELLEKAKAAWPVVNEMVDQGLLIKKEFQGNVFYARKLSVSADTKMLNLRME